MKTAKEFYDTYNGNAVDDDGAFGVQCVDGFRVFTKWLGIGVWNTGTGWADGYWYNRARYQEYFDEINNYRDLKDGDWCFWAKGSKSHPSSHVAMYYSEKSFGENQGGNGGFNLKATDFTDILGALRPKEFRESEGNTMAEIQEGYSEITYQGIKFYCYKQKANEEVKLLSLKHPKTYKLTGITTSDYDVVAKKNASFFVMSTGYVNGSEVSDIYDEAVPTEQGFIDVVQLKDGSWKFGNFGYNSYRKDTVNLRYSTGACLLAGGAYSEEYSKSCTPSVLTDKKIQSCLGIDWSNRAIFITTAPSQTTTPSVLRELGKAYSLQYLFRDDGGGSSELVVDGQIKNGVTSERALPNCLAMVKKVDPSTDDTGTPNLSSEVARLQKELQEAQKQVETLNAKIEAVKKAVA